MSKMQAEKLYVNGTIVTMNPAQPTAEAVATYGKMIIGVGTRAELENLVGPATKVVDLGGQVLMPGFNDPHTHFIQRGILLGNVDLSPAKCPDIPTMQKLVKERADQLKPGEWVYGNYWDNNNMKEGRFPNRQELTEAAPNNPCMLARTDLHMIACNDMALEIAGITDDTPDPPGGFLVRDENGRPTGILQELAQDMVRGLQKPYNKQQMLDAMVACGKDFNRCGITSTGDASTLIAIDYEMPAWYEAWKNDMLTCRIGMMMSHNNFLKYREFGLGTGFGDEMFRFNSVKYFVDGSLSGGTSGMNQDFLTEPGNKGVVYYTQEELDKIVMDVHAAGLRPSIHAIGDRAVEMLLTSYEKALAAIPKKDPRFRIEHCSVVHPEALKRIKKLGVVTVSNHAYFWYFGAAHLRLIGDMVVEEFASKTFMKEGIHFAISSDCPVLPPDVQPLIYSCSARRDPDGNTYGESEEIAPIDAFYAMTAGGAYLTFEEKIKGTIEIGKLADFAIVDLDPYKVVDKKQILDMKILQTVLGGKTVYEA